MSDIVLSVENVSKRYRIGAKPHAGTLREAIAAAGSAAIQAPGRLFSRRARGGGSDHETAVGASGEFWALRDVSFQVRRGEVLGIIGRNGAGKSTLLKIISKITAPTTGRVGIRGRVGSLLEVGTGFHPELTGRENIYLNAAVLGMRSCDVKKIFDEIVAFAEIGTFLDTPVKRYSSGMYVRLGFAVAAHLRPDVLILDEVLMVGDAVFRSRCLERVMHLVDSQDSAVLVVSHSPAMLIPILTSCLLLKDTLATRYDEPERAISMLFHGSQLHPHQSVPSHSAPENNITPRRIRIVHQPIDSWQPLTLDVDLRDIDNAKRVTIAIYDISGIVVAEAHYGFEQAGSRRKATSLRCLIESLPLVAGSYVINLAVRNFSGEVVLRQQAAGSFQVVSGGGVPRERPRGVVALNAHWDELEH